MSETIIRTEMTKEHGRWVIRLTVPEWVLADLLTDQQDRQERIPVILQTPQLGQSMHYGKTWRSGEPYYVTIDHSITPYLGTVKFEKTNYKAPGVGDEWQPEWHEGEQWGDDEKPKNDGGESDD